MAANKLVKQQNALDYFEEMVVQCGSTRVVIVRVPGGFLYNGVFAWLDDALQIELDD